VVVQQAIGTAFNNTALLQTIGTAFG